MCIPRSRSNMAHFSIQNIDKCVQPQNFFEMDIIELHINEIEYLEYLSDRKLKFTR